MNTVITNVYRCGEGNDLVPCEVRIHKGLIAEIESVVSKEDAEIIDGKACLISAGFVDVHVHLREPGFEHKETIATGSYAAATGGFTTICAMPNTKPVLDSCERIQDLQTIIDADAVVNVLPYGAITHGLTSHALTDFAGLKKAGVFALTNDGVGVQDAGVMLQAMIKAKECGLPIVCHTEEDSLLFGGVMHDGIQAQTLGLPGMSGLSESVQIARDVLLAKKTGVHYHVCHVSDADSVAIIREAKRCGVHVSAEVTPHHLLLVDEDILEDDANYKMNPPLRSRKDRDALRAGLLDGTLDFIATDHAPHSKEEKSGGFMTAPFGIIGLEHAFPLLYTHCVKTGWVSLSQLLAWMSEKPAQVFGLNCGSLRVGAQADVVLIDLSHSEVIQEPFASKSSNTPFLGWEVNGKIMKTMVNGVVVYEA